MNRYNKMWRLLPLVAVAACSTLTKVEAPDIILPTNIADAAGARLLYVGAATSMGKMYGYFGYTWDLSDEVISGFGNSTDQRAFSNTVSSNSSADVGYGYVYQYGQASR